MKATGIVRRIDDLGRVVIPKEIRRTAPPLSVIPCTSDSPKGPCVGGIRWFLAYFMARYRKLTTCPRVQALPGANVVAVLPAVILGVWFTAQSMAS